MQNIGNTYQTIKNNVASNGNVNSTVSKQNATDFSDLFSSLTGSLNSTSLTATSSVQNSMNVKSTVRTGKNVKTVSSNKTLDKSSNTKTDTLAANKNSVKQNNHAAKSVKAQESDNSSNDEEISSNKKKTMSSDEIFMSELLGTENTELVLDNADLLDKADNYSVDFVNANQVMDAGDVNALNQKIELADKIVQRTTDLIKDNADSTEFVQSDADLESFKNSLLNLSNDDLSSIEKLDDSKLNEFVKTALTAKLSSDSAAQNSKNTTLSSNTVSAEDTGLDSWFNELLADADVESVKVTANENENTDFGADDFDLIEQSLKLSKTLDDRLAKADVKSKIDSIMDSKEEASENTLAKSLELLRGATQGKSNTGAVSSRITLDNTNVNTASEQKISSNGFQSLEQAIKSAFEGSSSAMSSDLSDGGNTDSNQNQSFQSMLQQSAATNKENAQSQISKQFDLLTMSSNLKQNAQALTEKVMQMASKNLKTMDLTLNPHGLGKMKISLDVGNADDVTKISISASSPATKALVEQGMEALRQTLRDNDINAKAEVTEYEDGSFEQNQNQEFADNQNQSQNGQHEQNHDDLNYGTVFASDNDKNNVSENLTENGTENIINSQNGDSVSYFA